MKRCLLVLLATLVLTFTVTSTATVFAKRSPNGQVKPDHGHGKDGDDGTGNGGDGRDINGGNGNDSSTSPKTGVDNTLPFVALITAAGVVLVSKKELNKVA